MFWTHACCILLIVSQPIPQFQKTRQELPHNLSFCTINCLLGPTTNHRNHVRGFQHICMIWQNSSAKGASAQGCQLENHQQDLALKKMNKKRLLCTTQWVGLPQDIVSMYLLSEWQWQLQSQHWQQCISTPTASDLLKPTSFEPVIASRAMQCNVPTISQCPSIVAMDCSSGTQDHPPCFTLKP
jgi:hypothetical protein